MLLTVAILLEVLITLLVELQTLLPCLLLPVPVLLVMLEE
jgi:hypothetical protein